METGGDHVNGRIALWSSGYSHSPLILRNLAKSCPRLFVPPSSLFLLPAMDPKDPLELNHQRSPPSPPLAQGSRLSGVLNGIGIGIDGGIDRGSRMKGRSRKPYR